ncbi:MAG: flagellar basal body P-ring protein FlgI [Phycisphaerae bacterium]|nr:flagellar basal body P-ring protein FlgI [Phycisphaerae bacterium]
MIQRIFSALAIFALLAAIGCGPTTETPKVAEPVNYDTTIGELGEMYQFAAVPVRGYGIVAGLPGTGSSECPPDLREILVKDIRTNLKGDVRIDADQFINGLDTAVVEIFGTIPPIASKGDRFDIKVIAFSGTQTTSLAGGTLYPTELKEISGLVRFDQYAPILGKAAGPIFIDNSNPQASRTSTYVLGGGVAVEGVRLAIGLNKADYITAAAVRNRINERFGPKTAKAASPSEIEFVVPRRYSGEKEKFLFMVKQLYMAEDFALRKQRIEMLAAKLASGADVLSAEYALDAIGRPALEALAPLLEAKDAKVRFHAARCMLSIGDDRALPALRAFVDDASSPYRLPAIGTIGFNAKRDRAIVILTGLLGDNDFKVRFAAYEQLLRLDDVSVSRTLVSDKFFIDQVAHKGPPVIYIAKSRIPRVVLFGAPIAVEPNIFLESEHGGIVVNAPAGAPYVSVMRRLPNRPRLVGPLSTDYNVSDLVRTLCEEPNNNSIQLRKGLGASYADIAGLLAKMVETDIVKATLIAGDLTTAGAFVQKTE